MSQISWPTLDQLTKSANWGILRASFWPFFGHFWPTYFLGISKINKKNSMIISITYFVCFIVTAMLALLFKFFSIILKMAGLFLFALLCILLVVLVFLCLVLIVSAIVCSIVDLVSCFWKAGLLVLKSITFLASMVRFCFLR